jgi:hypothetical protein
LVEPQTPRMRGWLRHGETPIRLQMNGSRHA